MIFSSYRKEHPNKANAWVVGVLGALPLLALVAYSYVVQLRCLDANGEEVQSGSGLYTTDASGSYVDTDAHVLRADDGKYYGCNIYFPMPDSGAFYQSAYFAGPDSAKLYDKNKSVVDGQEVDGIDFAEIKIDGAFTDEKGAMYPLPPQQHDGYAPMDRACVPYQQAPFEIGSHMYTLGYPGVGDDSITFTDGVISGFTGQYGEYVKGSATTAPGSSGGVVIESNTGCFVGFIDSVETDSGGTIAQILSGSFISKFLAGQTGAHTYDPADDTAQGPRALVQSQDIGDISISYPQEWTTSTSTNKAGDSLGYFIASPAQGALDTMKEEMDVWVSAPATSSIAQQVADLYASAKSLDSSAVKSKAIVGDTTVFTVSLLDTSQQYFSEDVYTRISIFRYKDHDYQIESDWAVGDSAPDYKVLFQNIEHSINFR
jgi:hypothetical protein